MDSRTQRVSLRHVPADWPQCSDLECSPDRTLPKLERLVPFARSEIRDDNDPKDPKDGCTKTIKYLHRQQKVTPSQDVENSCNVSTAKPSMNDRLAPSGLCQLSCR